MKIGWYCGEDDWAFRHVTEHLEAALEEYQHVRNKSGDISMIFAMETLAEASDSLLQGSIGRLGGNRWYT